MTPFWMSGLATDIRAQDVWVSDWGTYTIPPDLLATIRIRKDGWLDGRSPKRAAAFLAWLEERECASGKPPKGKIAA